MGDRSTGGRRQAIRLAENRLPDAALQEALLRLVDDSDPHVRFQLALTVSLRHSDFAADQAFRVLEQIALGDMKDPWVRIAVLTSAAENAGRWSRTLVESPGFADTETEGKQDLLRRAAAIVGARHDDAEMTDVLTQIRNERAARTTWWRKAGLDGLGDGLSQGSGGGLRLAKSQPVLLSLLSESGPEIGLAALRVAGRVQLDDSAPLRRLIAQKSGVARDEQADLAEREYAVGILGLTSADATLEILTALLVPQQPKEIRRAAALVLAHSSSNNAAEIFIENWRSFSAPVREIASGWFFSDRTRLPVLLDAMEAGGIQPWSLGAARVQQLQRYPDERIKQRALTLIEQARTPLNGRHCARQPDFSRRLLGLSQDRRRGP